MKIRVDGVQSPDADTAVYVTNNKYYLQDTSVTADDIGRDISMFYKNFAVHTDATNAQNVTVQIRVGSGTWQPIPNIYSSKGSPVVAPGEIAFFSLPMTGIAVRLLVTKPVAATDFIIHVAMSGTEFNLAR